MDAEKMKQVVLNLLTNAIKYNQKGGVVRVTVTTEGFGRPASPRRNRTLPGTPARLS